MGRGGTSSAAAGTIVRNICNLPDKLDPSSRCGTPTPPCLHHHHTRIAVAKRHQRHARPITTPQSRLRNANTTMPALSPHPNRGCETPTPPCPPYHHTPIAVAKRQHRHARPITTPQSRLRNATNAMPAPSPHPNRGCETPPTPCPPHHHTPIAVAERQHRHARPIT